MYGFGHMNYRTFWYAFLASASVGLILSIVWQWDHDPNATSQGLPVMSHRHHSLLLGECRNLREQGVTTHQETFEFLAGANESINVQLASRSCACVDVSIDGIDLTLASPRGVALAKGVPHSLTLARPLPATAGIRRESVVLASGSDRGNISTFQVTLAVWEDAELSPRSISFGEREATADQLLSVNLRSREAVNDIHVEAEGWVANA